MADQMIPTIGPAVIGDDAWLSQEISAAEQRVADAERDVAWWIDHDQAGRVEAARRRLACEHETLGRLRRELHDRSEQRAHALTTLRATRAAAQEARTKYEAWLASDYLRAAAILISGRTLELQWIALNYIFEATADTVLGTSDPAVREVKIAGLFEGQDGANELTAPAASIVLANGRRAMLLSQFLHLPAVAELHQLLDQTPEDQIPAALCEPVT